MYIYIYVYIYIYLCIFIYISLSFSLSLYPLLCSFAKETYYLIEPTNSSYPKRGLRCFCKNISKLNSVCVCVCVYVYVCVCVCVRL